MKTDTPDSLAAFVAGLASSPLPKLAASHPDLHIANRPMDIYRAYLADILMQSANCEVATALDSVHFSNTLSHGDLVVPVPRLRLKGKSPKEQCVELAEKFPKMHSLFQPPKPSGIHLPLYVAPETLPQLILPYVFQRQTTFGHDATFGTIDASNPTLGRKRVVVEFSSPNIAKEFHAGHLRSTIIGAYISNLYKSMGWDVVKVNYLGDWGKQFGLLAVGWQRFGSEEELAKAPLKHLLEVYARINKLFQIEEEACKLALKEGRDTSEIESKGIYAERNGFFSRLEDGDEEALKLWQRFRDLSIDRYAVTYSRLNIEFDEYSGESQVSAESINNVEKALKEKGIYEQRDGSWMIDFAKHGAKHLNVAVVRGRTGTTTYLLRDVATVLEREKQYGFDKMIYVVSTEQDIYFQRLFKTLELMGRKDLAGRLQHVNFGKVLGMSSRLGNVKLLSDILDQCAAATHDTMRQNAAKYAQVPDPTAVADKIGISAVMVQDMTGKRIHDYPFDISRMTSFEGDTGPYLQYCHARLNSMLRRAELTPAQLARFVDKDSKKLGTHLGASSHCINLLRLVAQYPSVTTAAYHNLEPSTILTYLFRLTHQLSSCYDAVQVVGAEEGPEVATARAAMYESARQVLENGMRLLGITPVER
jgi:arginyl-tRNA synthetase